MKKVISIIIAIAMITAGAVVVVQALLAGDANGDTLVDNKDVVALFRHLSDGKTEVVEENCDYNNDGAIDNKDVVALFRALSGAGAETTEETQDTETEAETEPEVTEPEETQPEKPVLDDSYFIYNEYIDDPLIYMKKPDGYYFCESYLGSGQVSGVKEGVQDGTCFFNFMTADVVAVMTENDIIPILDVTKKNFNGVFGDYTVVGFDSYEVEGIPVTKLDWVWENGIEQSLVRVHFDYCTVIIQFATWATVPEGTDEFNAMIATLGICEEAL